MTITNDQFRADFPEFANTVNYPESMLTFWRNLAYLLLNADRWGDVLDVGVELYMAHNAALEYQAFKQSKRGVPGTAVGMLTSKSVDKVSAGYDVSKVADEFAGSYNLTTYGMRLWRLIQQFGAGPIQVGAGPGCPQPPGAFGTWWGPW